MEYSVVGMYCLWLCHTAGQKTLTKQVKSDKIVFLLCLYLISVDKI